MQTSDSPQKLGWAQRILVSLSKTTIKYLVGERGDIWRCPIWGSARPAPSCQRRVFLNFQAPARYSTNSWSSSVLGHRILTPPGDSRCIYLPSWWDRLVHFFSKFAFPQEMVSQVFLYIPTRLFLNFALLQDHWFSNSKWLDTILGDFLEPPFWRFPEMGVPRNHPCSCHFPWNKASICCTPMTMESPIEFCCSAPRPASKRSWTFGMRFMISRETTNMPTGVWEPWWWHVMGDKTVESWLISKRQVSDSSWRQRHGILNW